MKALYKPNQGYYVRLCSAIAFGTIVLLGGAWLWRQLDVVSMGEDAAIEKVYVQAGAALIFVAFFALIGYWLIGRKPASVDFLIACEGEMKKVNWSTRREIMGSTWAVIGLTFFIAIFCFGFDLIFQWIFKNMGVLES